jgi:hypothetical protein
MPIALNSSLIAELIESCGGVAKLLLRWGDTYGEDDVPNRQTLYNWRDGRLPKTSISIIRFAELLDVDPFCLLVARDDSPADVIEDVFQSYLHDTSAEPSLQFIAAFFGWTAMWPPKYWEEHRRKKPNLRHSFVWHEREFEHDTSVRANYYPAVALTSDPEIIASRPQTFHFAYSGKGVLGARWLHFGFVVRFEKQVTLTHIHGHTDACVTKTSTSPALVETWFGPGSARFRVASRHPFSLEFRGQDDGPHPKVRFPG